MEHLHACTRQSIYFREVKIEGSYLLVGPLLLLVLLEDLEELLVCLWLVVESNLDDIDELNSVVEFRFRTPLLVVLGHPYTGLWPGVESHLAGRMRELGGVWACSHEVLCGAGILLCPGDGGERRQGRRAARCAGERVHGDAPGIVVRRALGSGDCDAGRAALIEALDAVAGGQKRVEALDERDVPHEQVRHPLDDPRRVDPARVKSVPEATLNHKAHTPGS